MVAKVYLGALSRDVAGAQREVEVSARYVRRSLRASGTAHANGNATVTTSTVPGRGRAQAVARDR